MNTRLYYLIPAFIVLVSCKSLTKSNNAYITLPGKKTQLIGKGIDIAIANDSSIFVIGVDNVSSTGGYSISKVINNALQKMPYCAAVRVAVSPQGVPWVVNKSNLFYVYSGYYWTQLPGSGTDISIGADGSIYAIGDSLISDNQGYNILKWNGNYWDNIPNCAGIRIAVSPKGIPWIVNKSNAIFKYDGGGSWTLVSGVKATDIGIGGDGSVFVTGLRNTKNGIETSIYKYLDNKWLPIKDVSGFNIAVSPNGFPFWIDSKFNIYKSGN